MCVCVFAKGFYRIHQSTMKDNFVVFDQNGYFVFCDDINFIKLLRLSKSFTFFENNFVYVCSIVILFFYYR